MRTVSLTRLLALGTCALATAAGAGTATDPRDYNTFYAPAYRIPDASGMSAAAARGQGLFNATYRYLGAESGNRAANGKPDRKSVV